MMMKDIVEYLCSGALVEILKKHPGARAIWLKRTEEGEIAYTFVASEGCRGGVSVPIDGEILGKINPERIADVSLMLTAFGLSITEVNAVINSVGTAP